MSLLLESIASLVSPDVVEGIGWLLVHSLWQFAVIALLAFSLVRILTRRTAVLRYGRALLAMEEFLSSETSSFALSAKGSSLLARVQRLAWVHATWNRQCRSMPEDLS